MYHPAKTILQTVCKYRSLCLKTLVFTHEETSKYSTKYAFCQYTDDNAFSS